MNEEGGTLVVRSVLPSSSDQQRIIKKSWVVMLSPDSYREWLSIGFEKAIKTNLYERLEPGCQSLNSNGLSCKLRPTILQMCFSLVLQFFADFSWIAKFYLNLKMSVGGYKIRNPSAIHFITFSVVEWVDVFTRKTYCDIVLDSIRFCQVEKGLVLHAWCLMSNHLHLIASAKYVT